MEKMSERRMAHLDLDDGVGLVLEVLNGQPNDTDQVHQEDGAKVEPRVGEELFAHLHQFKSGRIRSHDGRWVGG